MAEKENKQQGGVVTTTKNTVGLLAGIFNFIRKVISRKAEADKK